MNEGYVLIHHGVKGQKWGVRRFQRKDGTLTAAGKKKVENYTNAHMVGRKQPGVKNKHMEEAQSTAKSFLKEYNEGVNKKLLNNFWDATAKQGQGRLSDKDYKKYENVLKKGMNEIDNLFNKYADTTSEKIMRQTGLTSHEIKPLVNDILKRYASGQKFDHASDFYLNLDRASDFDWKD